jgi:hypothetical protein
MKNVDKEGDCLELEGLHKIEKGCNHDTIAALDLFKLVPKKRLELSLGNPN